jgi:uncharacterized protein YukE
MPDLVTVDFAALQAGAGVVKGLADGLDKPLSQAVSGTAEAQVTLAGAACAGPLADFGSVLAPVTGDLVRALEELARGMEQAAERFHRVDAVLSTAADSASGPRVGRPW